MRISVKQKKSDVWTYTIGGLRALRVLEVLEYIRTPVRLTRKWNRVAEYKEAIAEREVS